MAGLVLPGEVYADPPDYYLDTTGGFILRSTIDKPITPGFSAGIYANFISMSVESGETEVDASIVSIGGALKVINKLSDTMELRLGVGLGYQMSEVEDIRGGEGIAGLDAAPIAELAVRLSPSLSSVFSIAAFSQPAGGNDEIDATWAPIIFIAGGIEAH